MAATDNSLDLAIIGGGPGGYAAAFRAADLGLDVTLICNEESLGGVCLKRGCIPSKALLSLSEIIESAADAGSKGISFGRPEIDVDRVRDWKDKVVSTLTDGLDQLRKKRKVRRLRGRAAFTGQNTIRISGEDEGEFSFRHAIIATGSRPLSLPDVKLKEGGRIMDSRGALALPDIPKKLLVVGGGYVGLELGQVYAELGSRVTVVEATDRLMGSADDDLVAPLQSNLEKKFEAIHFNTRAEKMTESGKKVRVSLAGDQSGRREFDRVLIAVNRAPNTGDLGLNEVGVETDDNGVIIVDDKRKSSNSAVFAIGDAAGGMMLAHEAMFEGKVAADVIAGEPSAYDVRAVPAVVYTHPQIAWCGLTERQAKEEGMDIEISRFPWQASGRALTMGAENGLTKLVIAPEDGRILGIGIVGPDAESLIAEGVHALEMGATVRDLALTMHPHPTLSETLGEAAERYLGGTTHL